MRPLGLTFLLLLGLTLFQAAPAQLNLPEIVQLPNDDFVSSWGETRAIDNRDRPDFSLRGVEASFRCTASGTFKPGSRMRDYYNLRDFEQTLSGSIRFIQDVTAALNNLSLANELQWAVMNCVIPEAIEGEDETQERLDKALERAERERERRREREEKSRE